MVYNNIQAGVFIERLNRFIAKVLIDGKEYFVHVRNTGRCKEILLAGASVILEESRNSGRKTPYTLIAVYKENLLVNIDSLAPNQVVFDRLLSTGISQIGRADIARREVAYGNSRFDIYFEARGRSGFIEVKGVTLERGGVAMFPDAPTGRGTKHLIELTRAIREGYAAYVIFVVQMKGVTKFTANVATDPDFAAALKSAADSGVGVLAYDSLVTPGRTELGDAIKVLL